MPKYSPVLTLHKTNLWKW